MTFLAPPFRYVEIQTVGLEDLPTDLINFSMDVTNDSLKLQFKYRSNVRSSRCPERK